MCSFFDNILQLFYNIILILLILQQIVLIALISHSAPNCQEKWLYSQGLILPWLSLIRCDISNQLRSLKSDYLDHFKDTIKAYFY